MAAYETAGQSDEWYTPSYIFEELGLIFDLDVACPYSGPLNVPCLDYLTEEKDGLSTEWSGLVWMNPPFGNHKGKQKWLDKFVRHGNGVALLPDRTSSAWWQEIASNSDVVCFVAPRVKFIRADGSVGNSPGTGTCLFAIGKAASEALKKSGLGLIMQRVISGEEDRNGNDKAI